MQLVLALIGVAICVWLFVALCIAVSNWAEQMGAWMTNGRGITLGKIICFPFWVVLLIVCLVSSILGTIAMVSTIKNIGK